jgi:hypothetical protein
VRRGRREGRRRRKRRMKRRMMMLRMMMLRMMMLRMMYLGQAAPRLRPQVLLAGWPAAARGPRLPAAVLLSVQRAARQLEGVPAGRLLRVAGEQALVDVGDASLREERVGAAVKVPLLCAGLPAGGVREGLQALVGVDEVLVAGLGRVVAPRLPGLALVLQVVGALLDPEGAGLAESVLLTEETLLLEVVVGGGAAGEAALAEAAVLALGLADAGLDVPHEAVELVVDVALEGPDGAAGPAWEQNTQLQCSEVQCSAIHCVERKRERRVVVWAPARGS